MGSMILYLLTTVGIIIAAYYTTLWIAKKKQAHGQRTSYKSVRESVASGRNFDLNNKKLLIPFILLQIMEKTWNSLTI